MHEETQPEYNEVFTILFKWPHDTTLVWHHMEPWSLNIYVGASILKDLHAPDPSLLDH